MSGANVSPMKSPFFMPDGMLEEVLKIESFHSRIFRLSPSVLKGDGESEYEKFMMTLSPFDPDSNYELNPLVDQAIQKTWTKTGDLLVHIEYIKWATEKKTKEERDW